MADTLQRYSLALHLTRVIVCSLPGERPLDGQLPRARRRPTVLGLRSVLLGPVVDLPWQQYPQHEVLQHELHLSESTRDACRSLLRRPAFEREGIWLCLRADRGASDAAGWRARESLSLLPLSSVPILAGRSKSSSAASLRF